ncbi:MAG: Na+/H+ antiporter NhaA [Arachnia sp.]
MTTRLTSTRARLRGWVTRETTGGVLLLVAAALALAWANSPWRESYTALSGFTVGPEALHLHLPLATWAADGLLAVFFFVVGVELKHELVAGSLSRPKEAAVPVLAAVGGMALPALLYSGIILALDPGAISGWAIPTATDIAFALAVLAIFGRGLPRALRTFLLTLAVVDDLLAIIVIAAFYTSGLQLLSLGAALVAVALFAVAARARRTRWWLLLPLAAVAWGFMHASGVHATIAGVLCGLSVAARPLHGEQETRTHRFEGLWRPASSGIALPVFAFFSAGVTVVGAEGSSSSVAQPVVLAVIVALVVGKLVGVLGTTALVTRLTPLRLPDAIGLRDLLPVGFLTGIGFTVALLIAGLSFPDGTHTSGAKIAVLMASALAAVLGAATLRWDAKKARAADMNEDGVVDEDISPIE